MKSNVLIKQVRKNRKRLILMSLAILIATGALWRPGSRPPQSFQKPIQKSASTSTSQTEPVPSVRDSHKPASALANSKIEKNVAQETNRKVAILNEILDSRNDNDPRLDREFNSLTPSTKAALAKKYAELRAELRNEKGTVVFLLGRNLANESDLKFMKDVLNEPSCLSLEDCSKADTGPNGDPDLSIGLNITLDYPKITAMKSLELFVFRNPELPLSAQASAILKQAEQTGSPTVKRIASSILIRLQQKG